MITEYAGQQDDWRRERGRRIMLSFVASLFGCAHRHCTFPMTSRKAGAALPGGEERGNTYIVCLDCGKEFPYDWQRMKVVAAARNAA
jgi:hypothetical protein